MGGHPWATADRTMIITVMSVVVFFFGCKLVWNTLVAVALARRYLRATSDRTSGISMAPFVEMVLLFVLIILVAFSDGSAWFNRPIEVALLGIMAIVVSYVIFSASGVFLGWLVIEIIKRRNASAHRGKDAK